MLFNLQDDPDEQSDLAEEYTVSRKAGDSGTSCSAHLMKNTISGHLLIGVTRGAYQSSVAGRCLYSVGTM
jgi:hypothetical protein